jgi:hypothetical protein
MRAVTVGNVAVDNRVTPVHLLTKNGQIITIHMINLVVGELEDGKRVFSGRCFDIFG